MSEEDNEFKISKINPELFSRIKGKTFKDNCTLPLDDLRYLTLLHKDINGKTLKGEMICNKYISEDLIKIFKKLYQSNYPIEKIRLMDEYDADDESAMRDNNSSCFNFRFISHTTRISKHGLGLAVDINTLYNPYHKIVDGKEIIEPATAKEYLDRKKNFIYKIEEDDICYRTFKEYGFNWGGNCWDNRQDYQHFEIPDEVIEKLYPGNV